MDIALQGIIVDANDKWDGSSKVIKDVADGVADNDAVNVGQLETHDTTITGYRDTTLAYKEDTEDYKLESADWATKVNGAVNPYTDNVAGSGSTSYSAKVHAVGGTGVDVQTGSAKDWATKATTPSSTATDASAKEWATGTSTHKNDGSAKSWAQDADAVDGAGANDRSAKAWSQGASMTGATLGGSSKDWANTLVTQIDGTNYSAKENATGVTTTDGSAKQWALGGGSFVEATEVTTGLYSARKYASDASASEVAAANSAAAVSQVYDNFSDVYLGSMADGATADTGTLTGASWSKDSSSIAFTGTTGTISVGQELTSTGSGYPVGANIIGSSVSTPLTVSAPFTSADSGTTLTFVGSGVYGAFNVTKDGPSTDNDGDALADGMLYFNTSDNTMKIYKEVGAEWIAATSAGSTSLLIYKYIATAAQTTFTGADANSATLSYTVNNINVFLNGVRLDASDYTATNGTSIVLGSGAALSDELIVTAYKSFTVADMVPASTGGTFGGVVTVASPVINTGVSGSAILDSDAMSGVSATTLSSSESIKAYADTKATTGKSIAMAIVFGS